MKKIFYILLTFLLFTFYILPLTLQAQPTQEWVRRFSWGTNNYASGLSVKLDSVGNVYVLVSQGTDSTLRDYGLLKYTPTGNLIWNRYYNNPGNLADSPVAFDVTRAGDIYITGNSGINFVYQTLTVKFNSTGVLQWAKIFQNSIGGEEITVDKDGNVLVIGNGSRIIKYNTNGDTLWTREIIVGPNGNNFYDVVTDDSSNVYAAGYYRPNQMQTFFLTVKYNSNGNLQWYSSYTSPPGIGNARCIALDSNRNVYVAGYIEVSQGSNKDNVLLKINSNGIMQWAKNYTGINGNHACSGSPNGASVSQNGNMIFYTTNCTVGFDNYFVTLAYNSNGDTLWTRTYQNGLQGGPNNNPATLKLDKYSDVYITGNSYNTSTGSDYITIKYLRDGLQQWVVTYNGYNNYVDASNDVIIDTSLNIYVSGLSNNSQHTTSDAATIKYSQPDGIISNNNELPSKFKLFQNYPNPFNSSTIINYEIPIKSFVQLNVYNSMGQLVKSFVNKEQVASYYSIVLAEQNLSSGVYFYQLSASNKIIETKKMIIIK